MTDRTHPDSGIPFTYGNYANYAEHVQALHARIAEMEAQLSAIGAGGVSGPLMGQPQAMPDLSALTERGAKAWAGVDARESREGFTAADMATAAAQGFRDGVASLAASAGSEPVAWLVCTEEGDPSMVFLSQHEAQQYLEDDERPTPLYLHHSPPEGMVGGWQDIATAPKDGTYLLLWEQYSTNPFVGCWAFGSWSVSHEHVDAEGGWDGANVVDSISQDRITHWMPVPLPPTSFADSRKGE